MYKHHNANAYFWKNHSRIREYLRIKLCSHHFQTKSTWFVIPIIWIQNTAQILLWNKNTSHTDIGSVAFFSHAFSASSKYGAKISLHFEWYEFNQFISSGIRRLRSINFVWYGAWTRNIKHLHRENPNKHVIRSNEYTAYDTYPGNMLKR